ncbi:MAG: hypothetical protein ACKOYM_07505, partial [Actinomycetes bacterium]
MADPDTAASISFGPGTTTERKIRNFVAALPRPDLAKVARVRGTAHGFDVRLPWDRPGLRQVCVWAGNVGAGKDTRTLGCPEVVFPDVQPLGMVQSVEVIPDGAVRVSGWAFDPETSTPTDVVFRIDGKFVARRAAGQVRTDIGQFFRRDARVGFDYTLPLSAGAHRVCTTVRNAGLAGRDVDIDCRVVTVPAPVADHRPVGALVVVRPTVDGLIVTGTASDPDGAVSAVQVGVESSSGNSNVSVPVSDSQFTATVPESSAGPVRVCVTIVDTPAPLGTPGPTGDVTLPCAAATMGGSVRIGTTGAPTRSLPVGPAADNPIAGVDRDAGVSTTLTDGSVFWIFGDSTALDDRGDLRYFVHNTAAIAAPGALSTTADIAAGVTPVQFATPTSGFPACSADRPQRALWPLSAVSTVDGGTDRVVVFMAEMCLGTGAGNFNYMGVSVVEWRRPAPGAAP